MTTVELSGLPTDPSSSSSHFPSSIDEASLSTIVPRGQVKEILLALALESSYFEVEKFHSKQALINKSSTRKLFWTATHLFVGSSMGEAHRFSHDSIVGVVGAKTDGYRANRNTANVPDDRAIAIICKNGKEIHLGARTVMQRDQIVVGIQAFIGSIGSTVTIKPNHFDGKNDRIGENDAIPAPKAQLVGATNVPGQYVRVYPSTTDGIEGAREGETTSSPTSILYRGQRRKNRAEHSISGLGVEPSMVAAGGSIVRFSVFGEDDEDIDVITNNQGTDITELTDDDTNSAGPEIDCDTDEKDDSPGSSPSISSSTFASAPTFDTIDFSKPATQAVSMKVAGTTRSDRDGKVTSSMNQIPTTKTASHEHSNSVFSSVTLPKSKSNSTQEGGRAVSSEIGRPAQSITTAVKSSKSSLVASVPLPSLPSSPFPCSSSSSSVMPSLSHSFSEVIEVEDPILNAKIAKLVKHHSTTKEFRTKLNGFLRRIAPDNHKLVALSISLNRKMNQLIVLRANELSDVSSVTEDLIDSLEVMFSTGRFNSKPIWAHLGKRCAQVENLKLDASTIVQFGDGTEETIANIFEAELNSMQTIPGVDFARDLIALILKQQLEVTSLVSQASTIELQLERCAERIRSTEQKIEELHNAMLKAAEETDDDKADREQLQIVKDETRRVELQLTEAPAYEKQVPVKFLGIHMWSSTVKVPSPQPGLEQRKANLIALRDQLIEQVVSRHASEHDYLEKIDNLRKPILGFRSEQGELRSQHNQIMLSIAQATRQLEDLHQRRHSVEKVTNEPLFDFAQISEAALGLQTVVNIVKTEAIPTLDLLLREAAAVCGMVANFTQGFEEADVPFLHKAMTRLKKLQKQLVLMQFQA